MTRAPAPCDPRDTGREIALRRLLGDVELCASVDLVGGGLRALTLGGADLVESYPPGEDAPFCSGALLFPWPNRVRDGQWTQRGIDYQLPVTEPELGHATHGLVLNDVFAVEHRTGSEVTVSTSVARQPGYPFLVRLQATYRLTDDGLDVKLTVTNESHVAAPFALGVHPYLRIGNVPVADLTVRIAANTYFTIDDRLIPLDEQSVDATDKDLRDGRRVALVNVNTCYHSVPTLDGRAGYEVAAPDGRAVELWTDDGFPYVHVYTCAIFPRGGKPGLALAIEPATAPANALNSGVGLRWLEPRGRWDASWGIRLAPHSAAWPRSV